MLKYIYFGLILLIITGCGTKNTTVVLDPETIIVEKALKLRNDFENNIGHKVYFAFDSATLSNEAKSQLERQARWLVLHTNVIAKIEGHCDERGAKAYNYALGLRRADAARKYLISLGVDEDRLSIVSYGKERPEVREHNKNAWKLNRRAVSVVIIKVL